MRSAQAAQVAPPPNHLVLFLMAGKAASKGVGHVASYPDLRRIEAISFKHLLHRPAAGSVLCRIASVSNFELIPPAPGLSSWGREANCASGSFAELLASSSSADNGQGLPDYDGLHLAALSEGASLSCKLTLAAKVQCALLCQVPCAWRPKALLPARAHYSLKRAWSASYPHKRRSGLPGLVWSSALCSGGRRFCLAMGNRPVIWSS